jgi:hypothetical protein
MRRPTIDRPTIESLFLAFLGAMAVSALLVGCGNRYELAAAWNDLRGDGYALDAISRDLPEGASAGCPEGVPFLVYRGEVIPYRNPVPVAEAFVPKLRAFERIATELARKHYGRAPDRMVHYGGRVCRTVRGSGARLSEHALGNAIDLSGFEWKRASVQSNVAAAFVRPFRVSVLEHWNAQPGSEGEVHRRFLRELVERVIEEDLFRGVIGPGREGHANHLHFDAAPWRYTLL